MTVPGTMTSPPWWGEDGGEVTVDEAASIGRGP
jgi:hypothetical protein